MSESEVLPASSSTDDDRKRELNLREREVAAREREITAKEAEINKSPWLNPLVIGLFAAAIGLIGNCVVATLNNQNSLKLERFRAQSDLINDAVKTHSFQDSCTALVFLVNLKLVDDTDGREGRIMYACNYRPEQVPAALGWSNLSEGPTPLIPPIVKGGAPVGTKYQAKYKKNDLECVNETVKVSVTEWQERTASSDSPAACQVDATIFQYSERESKEPQYFLLYDEGRNLFARLPNIAVARTGPSDWRLVSNHTWNVGRSVTRVN
ncbi:MAG: hypothetical protein ACRD8A_07000 [Candidatus Acidiferrales bacterium]